MAIALAPDSTMGDRGAGVPIHFHSRDEFITPEWAATILATMNWERQREIRASWVEKLKMAMLKGELTFISLVFAEFPDGKLILVDGQHRLSALVEIGRPFPATVVTHRVTTTDELGKLYLKFDRPQARGPETHLKALGVFDETSVPPNFVRRMGGAVAMIATGFARGYRQTSSMVERTNDVRAWLPEIEAYHKILYGVSPQVQRRLMRQAVVAVALVTIRYQPGLAESFWTKTATQEMLGADDPRKRLFTWLDENTVFRNKRGLSEIAYSLYVATAWNAFAEGRSIKLLKVPDVSAAVRLVGTPYQG